MVKVVNQKRLLHFFLVTLLTLTRTGVQAAEDPKLEAEFQLGVDALQDERLKSAVNAFRTILDSDPELHRARLELALAYYRSLRFEEAEQAAQVVLDNPNTPPEVRVTVLAFLAQIKRESEQLGQKHDLKPFISLGIMHDSNVNVGPGNEFLNLGGTPLTLSPGSASKSDNAYVVNVGVDHLYQSGRRVEIGEQTGMLVWQSGASIYRRKYNRFSDFDLGIASLSTGPAVLLLRKWRASLQFQSDYLTLGGGALGWFNGVTPSMTWQFDNGELTWDATYTRRNYHRNIDSGREGNFFATGPELGRYLNRRKIALTAGAKVLKFNADDDQFGYNAIQANAGINVLSWKNGSVYARQRITHYAYDGKDDLAGKSRSENEYRTTIGLSHEYKEPEDLLRYWVVSLFWERTRNNSNVGGLYSYDRYQSMFSLSRSF